MIRAGDAVNGLTQTRGQKLAIQDVTTEYGKNAFTRPEIVNQEPNLADLTHVGARNAPVIRQFMIDENAVGYGSGMMDAQVGKTPAGAVLRRTALPSADADMFIEDAITGEATLLRLGGERAVAGTDIHSFPGGYPDVGQATNTPVSPGSYLFGNRYRSNPFIDEITQPGKTEGYTQGIKFEHLNVQYRKLTSAVRDDVADPMNKGYRLGKDLSRLTRVGDVLDEQRAIRNPGKNIGDSAFDRMLRQEITYNEQSSKGGLPNVRTDTLFNIRARYEANPTSVGNAALSSRTSGVVPSLVASVSPMIIQAIRQKFDREFCCRIGNAVIGKIGIEITIRFPITCDEHFTSGSPGSGKSPGSDFIQPAFTTPKPTKPIRVVWCKDTPHHRVQAQVLHVHHRRQ